MCRLTRNAGCLNLLEPQGPIRVLPLPLPLSSAAFPHFKKFPRNERPAFYSVGSHLHGARYQTIFKSINLHKSTTVRKNACAKPSNSKF